MRTERERSDRSSGFLERLEKTEKGFQRRSQKLNENSLLERISTTVAGLRSRRSARLERGEHVLCEFCCTNWRRTLFGELLSFYIYMRMFMLHVIWNSWWWRFDSELMHRESPRVWPGQRALEAWKSPFAVCCRRCGSSLAFRRVAARSVAQ